MLSKDLDTYTKQASVLLRLPLLVTAQFVGIMAYNWKKTNISSPVALSVLIYGLTYLKRYVAVFAWQGLFIFPYNVTNFL